MDSPCEVDLSTVARWEKLTREELEAELEDCGVWDGFPIASVSLRLVERMVAASPGANAGPLATVPPLRGQATVEAVAVLAALAGCDASLMPVVTAAVRALDSAHLNALGVLTTTGNAALMCVVNGPCAPRLGYRSGGNALGPGSRANAVTGRALSLVCRALGGAREGLGDMATMGQPAKYGFCFAENEAASPWESYAVEKGFGPEDSTVTVVGISGILEVFFGESAEPQDLLGAMADVMAVPAAVYTAQSNLSGGGHPFVVISPEWAHTFAAAGLSKSDVKRELHSRALWRKPSEVLRAASRAEDVSVLVVGGVGIKQTYIPNWSGGSTPIMVQI